MTPVMPPGEGEVYKLPDSPRSLGKASFFATAAALGVVFLIMLGLKLFIAAVEWMPDTLYPHVDPWDGLGSQEAYERQLAGILAESVEPAGAVAYVSRIAVPAYGVDEPLPCVFVPVEVTYPFDRPTGPPEIRTALRSSMAEDGTLLPGGGNAVSLRLSQSNNYDALYFALDSNQSGREGRCWMLFPFLIESPDAASFWEPEVRLEVVDDEGIPIKSLAYQARSVSLAELDAIAEEERG